MDERAAKEGVAVDKMEASNRGKACLQRCGT